MVDLLIMYIVYGIIFIGVPVGVIVLIVKGIKLLIFIYQYNHMDGFKTPHKIRKEKRAAKREMKRNASSSTRTGNSSSYSGSASGNSSSGKSYSYSGSGSQHKSSSQSSSSGSSYRSSGSSGSYSGSSQRNTGSSRASASAKDVISDRDVIVHLYKDCKTKEDLLIRQRNLRKLFHPDNWHDDGTMFRLVDEIYNEKNKAV